MLPDYLRRVARDTAAKRKTVNLAVFGPGKGSPYFEKREAVVAAVGRHHPDVEVNFYLIDDREPPTRDYGDYISRVRPAEMKQIIWADIILFLFTHHRLNAFVEFMLVQDHDKQKEEKLFNKCGVAIEESVEAPSLWFLEARRFCEGRSDRFTQFSLADLQSCRVASEIAVDLFERVVLERWSSI